MIFFIKQKNRSVLLDHAEGKYVSAL